MIPAMPPKHRSLELTLALIGMTCLVGQAIGQESPLSPSPQEAELLQEAPVEVAQTTSQPRLTAFEGIRIEEVLRMAIERNPDLQVLKAKVKASQMQWLAEGLLPNPEVTGGSKKVSGDSSGPVLELSQEIPVNGSLRLERESARLEYQASQAESLRKTQEILHRVEVQVIELLSAKEAEVVENENLRITTESYGLVADRFESGLESELPLSLSRAEKGSAENSARLANREVILQREKLAAFLGITEAELPAVGGSLVESLLPDRIEEVGLEREDLRAKDLEVRSAQTEVEAARRARIPNPVLGYSREEAGKDTENFFTLSLEVPLWNSGRPEVQSRSADYEVVRKERESLEQTIEFEKSLAWRELQERREAVDHFEREILPAIHDSLIAAGASFRSGKTDLSLLLQTQTRLVEIQREALKAKKMLRLAEVNYLLALGLPPTLNPGE